MAVGNARAAAGAHVLELSLPTDTQHNSRVFVLVLRKELLQLGVHAAVYEKQIEKAIVVEVGEARAPADVACKLPKPRFRRHVFKMGVAIVAVQDRRIVGEMSLEDVGVAGVQSVADGPAHPSLFAPVL